MLDTRSEEEAAADPEGIWLCVCVDLGGREKVNMTSSCTHDQEKSLLTEVLPSWFFFSTLATANSKSSWVTCCRRSRKAYMPCYDPDANECVHECIGRKNIPASVQIPRTSAPEHWPIFSARALRLIPRCRDICGEISLRIDRGDVRTYLARMDTQDADTRLRAWWWEFDLSVNPPRSKEGGVKNICE